MLICCRVLSCRSDYFSVGDLILEINEKDVTKLKHNEIIKFIQDAGKSLCFKMQYKRLPEGIRVLMYRFPICNA